MGLIALFVLSTLSLDEKYWVGRGRKQLPAILAALVMSEIFDFASAYRLIYSGTHSSFNEAMGPVASIYFSVSTWTTTGFGDIHPNTSVARLIVSTELVFAVVTVLTVLTTAVNKAFSRTK